MGAALDTLPVAIHSGRSRNALRPGRISGGNPGHLSDLVSGRISSGRTVINNDKIGGMHLESRLERFSGCFLIRTSSETENSSDEV